MNVEIREAGIDDIAMLYDIYEKAGFRDVEYFERCLEEGRTILIISADGKEAGLGMLNRQPRYNFYRKLNIPEIQDICVVPEMRRRGLATAMIERFENIAREEGAEHVGISVAVSEKLGPAQRLYGKLGYHPDGNGVTYDREPVQVGQSYPPEELCLMLVRTL